MNQHDLDLDWITAQRPDDQAYDPDARDRALQALLDHTKPPRRRRRRLGGLAHARAFSVAAAAATAAVAAVLVLAAGNHAARDLVTSPTVAQAPSHRGAAVHHHHLSDHSRLVRLADYVSASDTPAGDATLVARTTNTGGQTVTVYDLYSDSGKYYFSPQASGLAAQVSAGHNLAGGLFAREVAAAKLAAGGDVQTAAQNMADAPDPSHVINPNPGPETAAQKAAAAAKAAATGESQVGPTSLFDNWAWEDSQDALIAGSGQPSVRAGVLKILATLPGVTVTDGTSNGEPTLVLTSGAAEVGSGYQEQLTIDADTGVPIQFVGGPPNGSADTTVTYKVSRVTMSDLSSGTGTTTT